MKCDRGLDSLQSSCSRIQYGIVNKEDSVAANADLVSVCVYTSAGVVISRYRRVAFCSYTRNDTATRFSLTESSLFLIGYGQGCEGLHMLVVNMKVSIPQIFALFDEKSKQSWQTRREETLKRRWKTESSRGGGRGGVVPRPTVYPESLTLGLSLILRQSSHKKLSSWFNNLFLKSAENSRAARRVTS